MESKNKTRVKAMGNVKMSFEGFVSAIMLREILFIEIVRTIMGYENH